MKAIVATGYGPPDVLRTMEVDTPTPGARDLLVRVHATTVTAGDVRIRGSNYTRLGLLMRLILGIRRPRKTIPGDEFSGVVVDAGDEVTEFAIGDQVFGILWGIAFAGANAEYVCVPDDGMVVLRPAGGQPRARCGTPCRRPVRPPLPPPQRPPSGPEHPRARCVRQRGYLRSATRSASRRSRHCGVWTRQRRARPVAGR